MTRVNLLNNRHYEQLSRREVVEKTMYRKTVAHSRGINTGRIQDPIYIKAKAKSTASKEKMTSSSEKRQKRQCNRPDGPYLEFITALVMQNAARNTMAWALETVNGFAAQTSACGRSLGGDHCGLGLDSGCIGRSFGRLGRLHVHLLLCVVPGPLVAELHLARPLGVQQPVPEDEEGLREIGLDTPALVMNVVVGGVVGGKMLQGIPGEGVAAVVVNGLDGRAGEEPHRLAVGHSGDQEGDARSGGI